MSSPPITTKQLFGIWWPLVASRIFRNLEYPIIALWVARHADAPTNLQALGGLLIPLGWLFECPVWMLLATSAALVDSHANLRVAKRFCYALCASIATIYAALMLIPALRSMLLEGVFAAPPEVSQAAMPGLIVAASWPFLVGYRRVGHGVLIRIGLPKLVTTSSLLRVIVLILGIVLAQVLAPASGGLGLVASVVSLSLLAETLFVQFCYRRFVVLPEKSERGDLQLSDFFYHCLPLIVASLLGMLSTSIGAAMLFRMPQSTLSLTVWPALYGLLNLVRTPAQVFIELSASVGARRENWLSLRYFAVMIGGVLFTVLSIFSFTDVGVWYFQYIAEMPPRPAQFAASCLAIMVGIPLAEIALQALSGILNAIRATRLTFEAAILVVAIFGIGFFLGVHFTPCAGAHWFMLIILVADISEVIWLTRRLRSRLASENRAAYS